VHGKQTASSLHKQHMLSSCDETHLDCHQVIESSIKKRRLTYHNLKKVIREKHKCNSALPSGHVQCTTNCHDVIGSPSKKHKLKYHNLKKVMRAKHECIDTLPIEHKHHMANDEYHHHLHHRHGREAVLLTNVGSNFDMACHQVNLVLSDNHKLTYHMLKKHIRERNRCNYISHIGHGTDQGTKITYRKLKQTLHNANIENQRTTTMHSHLGKRDAKKII
jgi:hypothetical protein